MLYSHIMIISNIPFTPTFEEYGKKIKLEKFASMEENVRTLFNQASKLLHPKALVKEFYIDDKKDSTVTIGGIHFSSTVLSTNLKTVNRVFAYVATCGNDLENFSIDPSDFMEQFLLDELKELGLRKILTYLRGYVIETYKLKKIASMNPGSADVHVWPIDQQQHLFSLLGDVEKSIGVKLTESHLMIPNKSVSGIYFPTEVDFEMCQECRRENCPDRRVPLKE